MKTVKNYSTVGLSTVIEDKLRMVRVEFDVKENDTVRVYAVSARNLARIRAVPMKIITRKQLSELPNDPYNDLVFANAAFGLLGLPI